MSTINFSLNFNMIQFNTHVTITFFYFFQNTLIFIAAEIKIMDLQARSLAKLFVVIKLYLKMVNNILIISHLKVVNNISTLSYLNLF